MDNSKFQMALPVGVEPLQTEMLSVPVRAISASLIECYMIDMSKSNVLKRGLKFLKKAKVYTDHWVDTGTVVGKVSGAEWNDGDVAGIDAELSVDTVIAPALARKILAGFVDSVSIGFEFEWEQSHKDMPFQTFIEMLGHDVDGELVRIVVTKIIDIYEISFVWEGADPSAKVNGKIGTSAESDLSMASLSKQSNQIEIKSNMEVDMNELEKLKNQHAELSRRYSELESEKSLLSDSVQTLSETVAQLQARADFGDDQIAKMRQDTKQLAMIFRGGDDSPAFDKLIDNADLETLQMLHDDFESKIDSAMPLKCDECGSTNVSRKSSVDSNAIKQSGAIDINPNDYRG
jgi:hypothetical protein